jgi:primosomal replication protein N
MDKIFDNNKAVLTGKIVSDFRFSHSVYGEGFYEVDIESPRLSGNADIIPVLVSERMMDVHSDSKGEKVCVCGQFRSYNKHEGEKTRLVLNVFAQEVQVFDEEPFGSDQNHIFLDGYICKEPVYRVTPKGREIADLLVAVNRAYGKSDYIPCICWGRCASYISNFSNGTNVRLNGRIQSREYVKKLSDGSEDKRIAYEVSVQNMEVI